MIKLRGNAIRFLRFHGQDAEADRDHRWADWMSRIARGDVEALSALYDESSSVIFSFVLEILHDRQAAEDALVEIYDRVRRDAALFDARHQALDWLIMLARNLAVERKRRSAPALGSDTSQHLFKQKRQLANLAVANLSDEQRSILEMTYLGGLNANEVADVLELPPEYVAEQIVLAMKTLRAGAQKESGVSMIWAS